MNDFKLSMFHLNHDMMLFHHSNPNATTDEVEEYILKRSNIDKSSKRYQILKNFIKEYEDKNNLNK